MTAAHQLRDDDHDGDAAVHAYAVRQVVTGGVLQFVPWCECGWEGEAVAPVRPKAPERRQAENQAAAHAFAHATGRVPGATPPRSRRPRHPQAEALFDASQFDRGSRP